MLHPEIVKNISTWKDSLYFGIGLDTLVRIYPVITNRCEIEDIIKRVGTSDLIAIIGSTLVAKGLYNLVLKYRKF